MGPTERQVAVLRRIAAAGGGVVASDTLRELVVDYTDGENGKRLLRRDLRDLRDRGFITTGITAPHAPRRSGVQLRTVRKSRHLHLSRSEHAALVRARERLRPGPAIVEVYPGAGRSLDLALAVVRYLEEGIGEASVTRLATVMSVPVEELRAALWGVGDNPAYNDESALADLEVAAAYANPDDLDDATILDWIVRLSGVEALFDVVEDDNGPGNRVDAPGWSSSPDRTQTVSPTRGRGLAHFGRFAYTIAETRERLDLIEHALACADTSEGDRDLLRVAGDKLTVWHWELSSSARR
ncbi:MAG: hypothetical protein QOH68_730 [Nocardioidaceae bacterium]|jgi:hypothetical protein|nr:hypothetical protein [Nocardioidaceae bacterium]